MDGRLKGVVNLYNLVDSLLYKKYMSIIDVFIHLNYHDSMRVMTWDRLQIVFQ